MTSTTTDPVRIVHHGDPDNPEPMPSTVTREQFEAHTAAMHDRIRRDSLPRVVDPATVTDTVVTRRLVVVDKKNRERIIAEETHSHMSLRILSPSGEAELHVMVGDEEESGEPYVLIIAESGAGTVTIDADAQSVGVEIDKLGPSSRLDLKHDGIEVHHYHWVAVYPDDK